LEPEFKKFNKIPRWNRPVIITEKIDGTNAQIYITESGEIFAGSRNKWLTVEDDNYGFASWVCENRNQLLQLGAGRHFGEWWGKGINRGYSSNHRSFSLFNVGKWNNGNIPNCVSVVPTLMVLQEAMHLNDAINECMSNLVEHGSYAAPGFMRPEGIVIYHEAAGQLFKHTMERDDVPKHTLDWLAKQGK